MTENAVNKVYGDNSNYGVKLFKEFKRKFLIKNYPMTGYYIQLGYNSLLKLDGDEGTNKWYGNALEVTSSLTQGVESRLTTAFPVNTFISDNIHRISFNYGIDATSVTGANGGNTHNFILLYAFDQAQLNSETSLKSMKDIAMRLNDTSIGPKLRVKYCCGIIKFESAVDFKKLNTIIDLSSIIIPKCSFNCLTESGLINVSHYQSDNLKLNNYYELMHDNPEVGNAFISRKSAEYKLKGTISSNNPSNDTFTIDRSGIIKY